jgi:hypothetical protein
MPPLPGLIAISSDRRRRAARKRGPEIGRFRARHLAPERQEIATAFGPSRVTVDELESPLVWLARRRARGGAALIEPHQLQAGERLRRDFTIAALGPRSGADWSLPLSAPGGGGGGNAASDAMADARVRVHKALDAAGPEFSGLLLDVCCFLKGLEDVERERRWPARSAKIVLRLALERLARHYGYAPRAQGRARVRLRTWLAEDAAFRVD